MSYVVVFTRVLVYVCAVTSVLVVYRNVQRRAASLGRILAAGILIRAIAGVSLFWISWLDLPVVRALHTGDGFWQLAPDARSYFTVAATAVEQGIGSISSAGASPAFTRTLAVWMWLVGISPASALLFNLLCYVGLFWMITAATPGRFVRSNCLMLSLVSLTFAPALLIFSTQPLKDMLTVFLVGIIGVAWLAIPFGRRAQVLGSSRFGIATLIIIGSGIYLLAGIRAYVAFLLWWSAAAASVLTSWLHRRANSPQHYVAGGGVLLFLWICFASGAGPYYAAYSPTRFVDGSARQGTLASVEAVADSAREGFENAGGATNIVPKSTRNRLGREAIGLAAMFVPISALKSLSIVNFAGGRGLLLFTDLDTVFLDLLVGVSAVWTYRNWRRVHTADAVYFLVSFLAGTTVLMAYVVTNYGTLVRLRLIVAAALWVLPAVVSATAASDAEAESCALDSGEAVQSTNKPTCPSRTRSRAAL